MKRATGSATLLLRPTDDTAGLNELANGAQRRGPTLLLPVTGFPRRRPGRSVV